MTIRNVEVRVVDNSYVITWYDSTGQHEEIIGTKTNLQSKLVGLFAE